MFIAIIGTPAAGKQTVLEYLVNRHGFVQVGLETPSDQVEGAKLSADHLDVPMNDLTVSSTSSPAQVCPPPLPRVKPFTQPYFRPLPAQFGYQLPQAQVLTSPETPLTPLPSPPVFPSAAALLDYATRNWLVNHVTTDLRTYAEVEPFVKRPFFLLVSVDGPMRTRLERVRGRAQNGSILSLETFMEQHDLLFHGPPLPTNLPPPTLAHQPITDFRRVMSLAQVAVCNNFPTAESFHAYLDELDLLDGERLRPGWDTYFMTLASLASHRSNCMKRRVGALLVRSKRILSTGYNGTPRGIRNCNEGGCRRCNGSARGGEALDECLCLHAEENALLEAGRERIGPDAIIYCNTCPCLRCSVKIVQCGVREVVYNQSYSMDAASAMVLHEGGVVLRQLHMPGPIASYV